MDAAHAPRVYAGVELNVSPRRAEYTKHDDSRMWPRVIFFWYCYEMYGVLLGGEVE